MSAPPSSLYGPHGLSASFYVPAPPPLRPVSQRPSYATQLSVLSEAVLATPEATDPPTPSRDQLAITPIWGEVRSRTIEGYPAPSPSLASGLCDLLAQRGQLQSFFRALKALETHARLNFVRVVWAHPPVAGSGTKDAQTSLEKHGGIITLVTWSEGGIVSVARLAMAPAAHKAIAERAAQARISQPRWSLGAAMRAGALTTQPLDVLARAAAQAGLQPSGLRLVAHERQDDLPYILLQP